MPVNVSVHSITWVKAAARVKTIEAGSRAEKRSFAPAEVAAAEAAAMTAASARQRGGSS